MLETVFQELLLAIGRFFINPLLYVALFVAVLVGYTRVKRERKSFHIRIHEGLKELKTILSFSFLFSIFLSIVTVAAGLTLPTSYLVTVVVITFIAIVLFNFHFLSAIITWGISYIVLLVIEWKQLEIDVLNFKIEGLSHTNEAVTTITIVIGLFLIVEGIVMHKTGAEIASPTVEKTSRGLKAIGFFSKKITIIPVLFIVPSGMIEPFAPWWPLFTIGGEQFGFVLFPVIIGFQLLTRRLLPIYFYPQLGRNVRILGELTVFGGAASYFDTKIAVVTLGIAFVMRIMITLGYKLTERKDAYVVAPSNEGAMIAAVLPDSPAEKMGLVVGEVITRINGRKVQTELEVYEALQINAAHCKLEVLDHKKELRLTQYVVHNEDHHQIGLLII